MSKDCHWFAFLLFAQIYFHRDILIRNNNRYWFTEFNKYFILPAFGIYTFQQYTPWLDFLTTVPTWAAMLKNVIRFSHNSKRLGQHISYIREYKNIKTVIVSRNLSFFFQRLRVTIKFNENLQECFIFYCTIKKGQLCAKLNFREYCKLFYTISFKNLDFCFIILIWHLHVFFLNLTTDWVF